MLKPKVCLIPKTVLNFHIPLELALYLLQPVFTCVILKGKFSSFVLSFVFIYFFNDLVQLTAKHNNGLMATNVAPGSELLPCLSACSVESKMLNNHIFDLPGVSLVSKHAR